MNETRPNSFHDVQCTRFNNMRKKKFNKQHTCFLHRISVSLSVRYTDNKGRCWRIAGFIFSRFVLFVFNFLFVWFFLSARGFFWLVVIVYMDFFFTQFAFFKYFKKRFRPNNLYSEKSKAKVISKVRLTLSYLYLKVPIPP